MVGFHLQFAGATALPGAGGAFRHDVQLKRRFDLIPNLIEAVKGYIQHERGVLENVTKARGGRGRRGGWAAGTGEFRKRFDQHPKTLFAVAENYPDLKANANFLDLQRELADTENKIQAARRFHNGNVRDLNTKISVFPVNLVVGLFGFHEEKFFEAEAEEKEAVKVKF